MYQANVKNGDRVCAIASIDFDNKVVTVCGFGLYIADEVPCEAAGGYSDMLRSMNHPCSKIRLDNSEIVWGCECWMLSEESGNLILGAFKSRGYEIKEVTPWELREV